MSGIAKWFGDYKDLLTAGVAVGGVLLALYAAVTNRNARRRDAMFRVQDLLTSSEQQHGRRLLFEASRTGEFPDPSSEEFAAMNRAIATLNAVGLYVRRKIVDRRWLLDGWHHPLRDIRPAAEAFLAHRRSQQSNQGWRVAVDLEYLFDIAARYRTRLPCCVEEEQHRARPAPQSGPSEPVPV